MSVDIDEIAEVMLCSRFSWQDRLACMRTVIFHPFQVVSGFNSRIDRLLDRIVELNQQVSEGKGLLREREGTIDEKTGELQRLGAEISALKAELEETRKQKQVWKSRWEHAQPNAHS